MRVEKTSFGYIVLLMPEEQSDTEIKSKIEKLKESGKVAVMISGNESASDVICKLIKNSFENK